MTMLRLHLRVWRTGPGLPAAGGMAALVIAAALLALWASIRTGIPILNITVTMLLPPAVGGSVVTTLLLPRRPVTARAAVPVDAYVAAPGTRTPALSEGCGAGVPNASGRHFPAGRARRPAAANRVPAPAAAGPAYRIGRAPVPGGAR